MLLIVDDLDWNDTIYQYQYDDYQYQKPCIAVKGESTTRIYACNCLCDTDVKFQVFPMSDISWIYSKG